MAISSQSEQECSAGSTTRVHDPDRVMGLHERVATKTCNKCGTERPLESFEITRNHRRGVCRFCRLESRKRNYAAYPNIRRAMLAKSVKWRESYPERKAASDKAHHAKYYPANKSDYLERFLARRAAKMRALPAWADRRAIKAVYAMARAMTAQSGVRHEVDHIIPLQGELVCGLHVQGNLRVILRVENRKKWNKLVDDIV